MTTDNRKLRRFLLGEEGSPPDPERLADIAPKVRSEVLPRALALIAGLENIPEELRDRLLAPLVAEAVRRGLDELDPAVLAAHPGLLVHLPMSARVALAQDPREEIRGIVGRSWETDHPDLSVRPEIAADRPSRDRDPDRRIVIDTDAVEYEQDEGYVARDAEEDQKGSKDPEDAHRAFFVNRGFWDENEADEPHPPHLPLEAGRSAYLWLEIGDRRLEEDAGGAAATLPADLLPERALLTVAVFGFPGDIRITPGKDVGEIEVRSDGSRLAAEVVAPAANPGFLADQGLLRRRLFFPVTLPDGRDEGSLRCNLYHAGVLVQSHRVTARLLRGETWRRGEVAEMVGDPQADHHPHGVNAEVDYTLSRSLRPESLEGFGRHSLSLLMNHDPEGSHSFHFFSEAGGETFKQSPSLGAHEVSKHLSTARAALRLAAWGSEKPWREGMDFRYTEPADLDTLTTDLARLAKAGRRIYSALRDALAGGEDDDTDQADRLRRKLSELTAGTGLLQIAAKDSATEVLPAALIHDQRIDSVNRASEDFTLCPEVRDALEADTSVLDTPCFRDECPTARKKEVVCPSGFWGYRHRIGMPLSVPEEGDAAAARIVYDQAPRLVMAKWEGRDFVLLRRHQKKLDAGLAASGAQPPWRWLGVNEGEALERELLANPHVVYFYCHGGRSGETPYLKIGDEDRSFRLDLTVIDDLNEYEHLFWDSPRPLVVLNGCHTTDLRPGDPYNLVTPFIRRVNAAGVIGSEITIFESLAAAFGEALLGRFLAGVPLGEAVRLARLDLLAARNPLGMAYLPFALGNLTMGPAAA